MQIDEALQFFAGHLQPRAIVLRGAWGVGKTFYWREKVVKGFFAGASIKRTNRGYAYVSLFGMESVQQLKNALAYSYEENRPPGILASGRNRLLGARTGFARLFGKYSSDDVSFGSKGVGAKVKAASLLNDLAFLSIKGSLVCIDDLERRNKKLSIGDVLGLVSYLVDQRGCRVALILNLDALDADEREEWDRSKDKTFETELLYQPTMDASIEIGMSGAEHEWWYGETKKYLEKLAVENIRIVARTQRFLRQLMTSLQSDSRLQGIPNDVWSDVVKVACLLVVAYNSRALGAPSLDELLSNSHAILLREEEVDLTDQEKKWRELLDGYGVYLGDSLDIAVCQSIRDGYPRMDLLVPAALDWREIQEKARRTNRLRQAWSLFHESLQMDMNLLVDTFRDALPDAIPEESVHNISAAGRLLRELGYPDEARGVFRQWIAARVENRRHELDEDDWFPGMHIDPEFLDLIRAARTTAPRAIKPLIEALQEVDSGSWSLDAIVAISVADAAAIADALRSQSRTWRRCVEVLSTYNGHDEVGARARENFMQALRDIAATSPLNRIRVKGKLGSVALDLEEPQE